MDDLGVGRMSKEVEDIFMCSGAICFPKYGAAAQNTDAQTVLYTLLHIDECIS